MMAVPRYHTIYTIIFHVFLKTLMALTQRVPRNWMVSLFIECKTQF